MFNRQEQITECMNLRRYFNPHYAASLSQQRILVDLALNTKPNDIIVELGVCNGQTAALLARAAMFTGALYYGVDMYWLDCMDLPADGGTVEKGGHVFQFGNSQAVVRRGEEQFNYLQERFDDLNINGHLVYSKTQDFGQVWAKNQTYILERAGEEGKFSNNEISLLFIDAGHDEANVKPDIEIWLPLVRPGGTVVFHDYDDPYNGDSAHWAVRYHADMHTQSWERQIVDNMLVTIKPMVQPHD